MSMTVFLVDDHAVLRDGLRLLLQMQPDIEVVGEAANGRDAVQGVARSRPDVVILDVIMPELNGIEAARQILTDNPAVKIIILSMNSNSEHIFRAFEAGARGYLLKASAGSEVVEAVRAVYAGRRYLSQDISDTMIDEYVRQRKSAEADNPLALLSPREMEVLQLIVEGHTYADIAERLALSPDTVKTYRSRIMQKLDINDLPGLVKFAIVHGLTSLDR
ncbi:MAG: response regulator transcription factor [Anaerolineae bacterium]|nr:response regulator transcription factor [Anaerolineae bacterium]